VHQAIRRLAVRREEKQTGRHHVEPSHIRQRGHVGKELEHGPSPSRIPPGHHVSDGLVQRDPRDRNRLHAPAPDGDDVLVRVHRSADGGDLPIDLDQAGSDQILGAPTRADTGPGKGPLQSHRGHASASSPD
jgi:hypothetical protein